MTIFVLKAPDNLSLANVPLLEWCQTCHFFSFVLMTQHSSTFFVNKLIEKIDLKLI